MVIMRRPNGRMSDSVTNIDWAIILVYLAGVVGLGIAAGFVNLFRAIKQLSGSDDEAR